MAIWSGKKASLILYRCCPDCRGVLMHRGVPLYTDNIVLSSLLCAVVCCSQADEPGPVSECVQRTAAAAATAETGLSHHRGRRRGRGWGGEGDTEQETTKTLTPNQQNIMRPYMCTYNYTNCANTVHLLLYVGVRTYVCMYSAYIHNT